MKQPFCAESGLLLRSLQSQNRNTNPYYASNERKKSMPNQPTRCPKCGADLVPGERCKHPVSSRNVPFGKILLLTRRKKVTATSMEARLVENGEAGFTLELPDIISSDAGQVWNLQYGYGWSIWEFDAQLLKADGRKLTFAHSEEIRFLSRRRFLRVTTHKDAYIAKYPFTGGREITLPRFVHGDLRELAGPGLLIETPLEVNVGDNVLTIIQATDNEVVQGVGEVRHVKPSENGHAVAIELLAVGETHVDDLVRMANVTAHGQDYVVSTAEKD
jgi:hypothetical protein